MASPFTILLSRYTEVSDSALREEIRSHTGSDEAASRILRCIERFGADPSIEQYEMTPTTNQRSYRGTLPVAWSVRAVRPELHPEP
jgi:hypothetical protein